MLHKSKKFLAFLISLIMMFSFAACDGEIIENEDGGGNPSTEALAETSGAPVETTEAPASNNGDPDALDIEALFGPALDYGGATPNDSRQFARALGHGINLGNTMEACDSSNRIPNRETSVYEIMWGQPVTTQEMITGLKNAGFTTLRIPVAWTNAMDFENNDFTIGQPLLNRVEEIVNYALNEDFYVIINNHWDHGWWSMFGHPDNAVREKAVTVYTEMWTQVSAHFKDYDERVVFESANEELGGRLNDKTPFSPTGGVLTEDECYQMVTAINQKFIDIVRTTGGNNSERYLLVKGYNTDVEKTVDSRYKMPVDPAGKLLLGVHYYTPWSYCGDTAGVPVWGTTQEVETMNELLGSLSKFVDQGYGLLMGEWGVLDNEGEDRMTFYTNFIDNCDKYGYATTIWDTGLIYSKEKAEINVPEISEFFIARNERLQSKTVDEVIAEAEASMEATLVKAADRPQFVYEADEAFAWIMYVEGGWGLQYSVGDKYNPDSVASGLIVNDVEVTGAGEYEISLDFTGTGNGYADGIEFSALGIMNGEILFPGYYVEIKELLINGQPANFVGTPYTTHDNPTTTRVNLYNGWVNSVPPEARRADGDLSEASPVILENYRNEKIETISIKFDYIAP